MLQQRKWVRKAIGRKKGCMEGRKKKMSSASVEKKKCAQYSPGVKN